MNKTLIILNAEIAKLTHMTSGQIGRDWRSGRCFVLHEKGSDWAALVSAREALRAARREIDEMTALSGGVLS